VPSLSGTDQRQSGVGRKVHPPELSMRLVRTPARRLKRSECPATCVDRHRLSLHLQRA
jgi:hypothetical protein